MGGFCEGPSLAAPRIVRSSPLTRQTFAALMRRLSRAGFTREFVRTAILPEWWDENCAQDPGVLRDFEIRVARFLSLPLSIVTQSDIPLASPSYPGAQLRRVRDVDRARIGPAIHSAMQIAAAVTRSLRETVPPPTMPSADGLSWRGQIRSTQVVRLEDTLKALWATHGIPVVPIEVLPAPSFQSVACIVNGRPVVLVGHKRDEPGLLAFVIAHEVGHIAAGDCAPDGPVVDEEPEEGADIPEEGDIERKADQYATRVLVGADKAPHVDAVEFKQLASRAVQVEHETGADADAIISAWAAGTRDYQMAAMARKALYRSSGARRQIRLNFDLHVNLEAANESDRNLLRCVQGDPERDESTD